MLHDIGKSWTLDLSGTERNGVFLYHDGRPVENSMVLPTFNNVEVLWNLVRPKEEV
jgi:hypothetical protein